MSKDNLNRWEEYDEKGGYRKIKKKKKISFYLHKNVKVFSSLKTFFLSLLYYIDL